MIFYLFIFINSVYYTLCVYSKNLGTSPTTPPPVFAAISVLAQTFSRDIRLYFFFFNLNFLDCRIVRYTMVGPIGTDVEYEIAAAVEVQS